MRTLWPKSMKIWWFNHALCSLIRLSVLRDFFWNHELTHICWPSRLRWRSNWNLFTVACNCSFLVIIIKRFRFYRNLLLLILSESFYCFSNFGTIIIIIIIIILSFRITPLTSQFSETAQHWVTKLHSYIDPYPTTCRAHFGVDPDYHSGSRAKSVFSDSPHLSQKLIIGSSIAIPLSVVLDKSYFSSSLS